MTDRQMDGGIHYIYIAFLKKKCGNNYVTEL